MFFWGWDCLVLLLDVVVRCVVFFVFFEVVRCVMRILLVFG